MTITQLKYVLAVAEHKNFTKAATHSFVTQPTLSMQIQKIEEELNKPIDLSTCQTSWVRFGLLLSKDLLAYSVPGLIILEMPRPTSPLNTKKDNLAETKYKVFPLL